MNLDDPQLVQAVLEDRLQNDKGLNTLLQTILAYSKTIYDAGITDVNGGAAGTPITAAVGHNWSGARITATSIRRVFFANSR